MPMEIVYKKWNLILNTPVFAIFGIWNLNMDPNVSCALRTARGLIDPEKEELNARLQKIRTFHVHGFVCEAPSDVLLSEDSDITGRRFPDLA